MKVLALLMLVIVAVFSAPSPQTENLFPIIPYEFAYEVADPPTNNYQNRAEIKLPNGDVFGSWSLLRPDGNIQTVTYNVTGIQGFQYSIVLTPTGHAAA
ncbi:cuticle protein 21-like [Macrobrachium rosenbergii]|uniref:cuticle protein 21-like n=1 Tax=Macrobrachium rosenbergii TaxID=79674 RepID=UPI0034D7A25C